MPACDDILVVGNPHRAVFAGVDQFTRGKSQQIVAEFKYEFIAGYYL